MDEKIPESGIRNDKQLRFLHYLLDRKNFYFVAPIASMILCIVLYFLIDDFFHLLSMFLMGRQWASDKSNVGVVTLICSSLFVFFLLRILYENNFKLFNEYYPCPYPDCRKSVRIFDNWQCDKCNNYQGKPRLMIENCVHCKASLETVFCEHCKREFKL
jgi:hypothetical protein